MPTGFDGIESGAALSQRLIYLTPWVVELLKRQPEGKALTGKEICSLAKSEKRIDIEGPDVRAMVNYLRRRENPIGSENDGYFWATQWHHLDSTILHLKERVAGISSALRGLEMAKAKLTKGQQDLF